MNITLLGKESQSFISSLSAVSRDALVSLALSKDIVNMIYVPSSKVENIQNYYNMQIKIKVERLVSEINELIPLDIDMILDMVYRLYCYKCNVTFDDNITILTKKENVTDTIFDFFGITKFIPSNMLTLITENPTKLTEYMTKFRIIIKELSTKIIL